MGGGPFGFGGAGRVAKTNEMDNNSILQKLDGLEARFEEVSTLITDPDVIADQNRFVKLTKEYKDLGDHGCPQALHRLSERHQGG